MSAGSLCSRVVATATPEETVAVAARRMVRNDVGTLVVVEGRGSNRPVGFLTDRDITTRCVAADLDPSHTAVSTIMSKPVLTIGEETSVEDALNRMADAGTRRLVVTAGDGTLAGVLTLDDVLEVTVERGGPVERLLVKQRPRVPG
jgi:CBS domain-containing protein